MYYSKILNCDIANGDGVRVTLFVSGCTNHCYNCFQPQTWDFNFGQPFTQQTEEALIKMLAAPYISGLTVLGGEPFEPCNQERLTQLFHHIRTEYTDKTIWCFSGFTYEQMITAGQHCRCAYTDELLSMIDVLVDGRYVDALRDISLRFRGSSNQRLINMKQTLSAGKIILLEDSE